MRDRHYIIQRILKEKLNDRLRLVLDMAESVKMGNYALMGTKKDRSPGRKYKTWRRRLEHQLNPEKAKIDSDKYWQRLKGSKRI